MNRQQAVQWCVDNIIEWPEFKPSIAPDGWYWTKCFSQWVLDKNTWEVPIDKQAWFHFKNIGNRPTYPVIYVWSKPFNCRSAIVPVTRRINHDGMIPCGQSFSDLMKELNNA